MFVEIKDEEPIDYCRLHEGKQSIEDNNVITDVEKIKVYCVTAYFKSNCVVCVVLCFLCLVCFVPFLVCPMLPASLDCPFLIAPSVFSNVYIKHIIYLLK